MQVTVKCVESALARNFWHTLHSALTLLIFPAIQHVCTALIQETEHAVYKVILVVFSTPLDASGCTFNPSPLNPIRKRMPNGVGASAQRLRPTLQRLSTRAVPKTIPHRGAQVLQVRFSCALHQILCILVLQNSESITATCASHAEQLLCGTPWHCLQSWLCKQVCRFGFRGVHPRTTPWVGTLASCARDEVCDLRICHQVHCRTPALTNAMAQTLQVLLADFVAAKQAVKSRHGAALQSFRPTLNCTATSVVRKTLHCGLATCFESTTWLDLPILHARKQTRELLALRGLRNHFPDVGRAAFHDTGSTCDG